MPRGLSSGMLAAFASPEFTPAILISMGFSGTTAYVWSGYGPLTWNGMNFTGLGTLISIGEQLEDGSTVEARGITVTFSGIDPVLLPDALNDLQLGLPVNIWLAVMSGGAPISSPVLLWSGATDLPQVEITGTDAQLTINCENLLISLNVPIDRRYTLQDSEQLYPGDLGFQFVDALQETTLYWGTTANATNSPSFVSRHEDLLLAVAASLAIPCLAKYKTNIQPLPDAEYIDGFHPVTFDWKATGERDIGMIADDIAAVDSRLGVYGKDGTLLNFKDRGVLAVVVKALQEQRDEIRALKGRG